MKKYYIPRKEFNCYYEDVGAFMNSENVTIDKDKDAVLIDIIMSEGTFIDNHWHDWVEFDYIVEGELEIKIDEKRLLLSSEDILMINFGLMHSLIVKKETHILSFQINCKYLVENIPWLDTSHIMCYSRTIQTIQDYERYKRLIEIFKEMSYLFQKQDDISMVGYTGQLLTFIYILQTQFQKDKSLITNRSLLPLLKNKNTLITNVIYYVNIHYQYNLTLNNVAEYFHVTPQYISKIFRNELSMTFKQYINIIRLKNAKYLMFNSNKNITDIAYSCGFPNTHAFINLFKKSYHMTPKKYYLYEKEKRKNENN